MKIHAASLREIRRISLGIAIWDLAMLTGLFLLSINGIGRFDHRTILGTLGGSVVAVSNFALMCLTIQNALGITDERQRKAFIQGSYHARLLLQAIWLIAAFTLPYFQAITAALPLLFPNLTIICLQSRGRSAAR